jgi:hypothetical protein
LQLGQTIVIKINNDLNWGEGLKKNLLSDFQLGTIKRIEKAACSKCEICFVFFFLEPCIREKSRQVLTINLDEPPFKTRIWKKRKQARPLGLSRLGLGMN